MNSSILLTPHLNPLQGVERAVERYLYPFPIGEERAVK